MKHTTEAQRRRARVEQTIMWRQRRAGLVPPVDRSEAEARAVRAERRHNVRLAVERVRGGESFKSAAKAFGVTVGAVREAARRAGLATQQVRNPAKPLRGKQAAERDKAVAAEFRRQVDALGCSPSKAEREIIFADIAGMFGLAVNSVKVIEWRGRKRAGEGATTEEI